MSTTDAVIIIKRQLYPVKIMYGIHSAKTGSRYKVTLATVETKVTLATVETKVTLATVETKVTLATVDTKNVFGHGCRRTTVKRQKKLYYGWK